MVRSVGGITGATRTARGAADGGPEVGTVGTGETAAYSSRSGATGAGAVGAGTSGVSHSHRKQWQPVASAGSKAADDFAGRSAAASSPQQGAFVPTPAEVGEQQDRFLAPG